MTIHAWLPDVFLLDPLLFILGLRGAMAWPLGGWATWTDFCFGKDTWLLDTETSLRLGLGLGLLAFGADPDAAGAPAFSTLGEAESVRQKRTWIYHTRLIKYTFMTYFICYFPTIIFTAGDNQSSCSQDRQGPGKVYAIVSKTWNEMHENAGWRWGGNGFS